MLELAFEIHSGANLTCVHGLFEVFLCGQRKHSKTFLLGLELIQVRLFLLTCIPVSSFPRFARSEWGGSGCWLIRKKWHCWVSLSDPGREFLISKQARADSPLERYDLLPPCLPSLLAIIYVPTDFVNIQRVLPKCWILCYVTRGMQGGHCSLCLQKPQGPVWRRRPRQV